MKRSAVVIAALAVGAVALPAQAASARDLYMTKDLENVNGVYIGDFAALEKKGTKVVGAVGAFSSEYICVKGTVKNGKLRARYYDSGVPGAAFTRKWVGTGSSQRIKGWTSITEAQASTYLESDARSFIADCRSQT